MRLDILYLWHLGDPSRPALVGTLRLVQSGKGVSLQYAFTWLDGGFALSEDLPLVDTEQLPPGRLAAGGAVAVGAVDDARPDRWGERVIQYIDRPKRLSLMEYLYFAGDDRFGALGVSTSASAYEPRVGGPLPRLDQVQQVSEVVAKVAAAEPISDIERRVLTSGGSFGGAKPKALIAIGDAQWVVKFYNGEPIDSPRVEHAAMTLAAKAGIRVAETRALPLQGHTALAVRRFDRDGALRLHGISAGTALRAATAAGQEPDFGYPALAQLLRRAGVAADGAHMADAIELFRRMVFNILMDNTDDHEKNHALLVVAPRRHGRFRLAPAYDVLPSNSGQGFQEFTCGASGRESTLDNALSQPEAFGLTAQQAAAHVQEIIAVVDTWQAHFRACGVSESDIDQLAARIDGDVLLAQRRSFDPSRHGPAPARRKRRRGPFAPR
jgi:serine/threonine-protein kinase HipA